MLDLKSMNRAAIYLMFFVMTVCCNNSYAQFKKKTKSVRDYMPTENIDVRKESNNNKNMPKRRQVSYIYKNELDGILYGNPCALEATRKMGFEYVFQPLGIPGSIPVDEQFSNNLAINFKLIFTRSPFWKLILNRRIKKCRLKSGDMVG